MQKVIGEVALQPQFVGFLVLQQMSGVRRLKFNYTELQWKRNDKSFEFQCGVQRWIMSSISVCDYFLRSDYF